MSKGLKRFLGSLLAVTMLISVVTVANISPVQVANVQTVEAAGITINGEGYQEGAYVKWSPVTNAVQYVVSYQKGSGSFTRIDDELIRDYGSYWRADVLGLSEGTYNVKVEAYGSSGSVIAEGTASNLSVVGYKRDGFAFKTNKSTPGAYNADGTLKSNAKVIYVTADNFNTVSLTEGSVSGKGFGDSGITSEKVHGKLSSPTPLCIRIIGTVKPDGIVKVKASKDYKDMFVTFEGVGEDAVVKEGFDIQKSANVEIKNLGISNFSDDGISIQSKNRYVWVHNVDFYYGNAGGDADQAKGDGSLDVKNNSQYCEFSYNHFWDSGKSSLCGMKSESGPNFISYHHNWFDHSDSRHPRIRTMSVHVYNNLYDGVSKYGIGTAYQSSAFVENNVFKNCKHPMLSSMQGSDLMDAAGYNKDNGTFSGEDGGIIKAYNNLIEGADPIEYHRLDNSSEPIYYGKGQTSDDTIHFDAYLASTRDEQVPSSVKAVQGGKTYDNAGLAVANLAVPDAVETVEATVKEYAGSIGGGIVDRTKYPALSSATDYGVDSALKSFVSSYDSSGDMTVGGTVTGKQPVAPTESTTEPSHEITTTEIATDDEEPEPTTSAPIGSVGDQLHIFDDNGNDSDFYSFTGNITTSKGKSVMYNNKEYEECLKMDSKGKVSFTNGAGATGKLTLVFNDTSKGRSVKLDGVNYKIPDTGILVIEDIQAGSHLLERGNDSEVHLYYILYEDTEVTEVTTGSSPEQTTESTTTAVYDDNTIVKNTVYGKADFGKSKYFTENVGDNRVYAHETRDAIRLKTNGSISFKVAAGATISISAAGANATESGRQITVSGPVSATKAQSEAKTPEEYPEQVYITNAPTGTYTVTSSADVDINKISVTFPGSGGDENTTVTTEATTQATTEATTEATTNPPAVPDKYGDADSNGTVATPDVVQIFKYVLDGIDNMANDFKEKIDLDKNNKIDSADVAILLQKILDSSYTMPVEK